LLHPTDCDNRQEVTHRAEENVSTSGTLVPGNKTQKKTKEKHTVKSAILFLADQYRKMFDRPTWTLTPTRRRIAAARLKECLIDTNNDVDAAVEIMLRAMKAVRASKFHMGENDSHMQYVRWEADLFKSEEKVRRWLDRADQHKEWKKSASPISSYAAQFDDEDIPDFS